MSTKINGRIIPALPPHIVGELYTVNRFGEKMPPSREIFFSPGEEHEGCYIPEGAALTTIRDDIYGNETLLVRDRRGQTLIIPGYAGLTCSYNESTGTLEDFKEN